jgi:exonuclease VII large subunit
MANEGDIVDAITWISKNDWERAKEKAYTFSSTITAAKADITLLKAEIAGLSVFSLGASLAKIDLNLLKIDEKGISVGGRQLYATKWVDEAKHFQTKMEGELRTYQKSLNALEAAQAKKVEKKADLDEANERLRSARNNRGDLSELARSAEDQDRAQRAYDRAEEKFTALHTKVNKMKDAIQDLDGKMKAAKPEKVFEKANERLKDFEQALQSAARQA